MLRLIALMSLGSLMSCQRVSSDRMLPSTPVQKSVFEVTGSLTQRVVRVSAILTKQQAFPSKIVDAHFREEQIGDNHLGPADFKSFTRLKVAPQDMEKWQKLLTPIDRPAYDQPLQRPPWWPNAQAFNSLQFYQPGGLTMGRAGWVGIARQTGEIYIFSFTM
jgi:hypothetical protein